MRTAINLWSLRNVEKPLTRIIEHVADAGYDGVQFSGGLRDATVPELRDVLDSTELDVTTPHVGIGEIEQNLESTVETYRSLGCSSLTIPYLDPSNFEDESALTETIDRLVTLQANLAEHDLELHYHNHDAEFQSTGDGVAFDRLVAETRELQFEIDVGWVYSAGYDPLERLRQVEGRCEFVHMRDVTADGDDVKMGGGAVDLRACAETAHEIGAEWLIYERIDPGEFISAIEHGAEYLGELADSPDSWE